MKTFYYPIFFTLMLQAFISNAQYDKLIDVNKKWIIKNTYKDLLQIPPPRTTYYFAYFEGDTVINNTSYKKLVHQNFHFKD